MSNKFTKPMIIKQLIESVPNENEEKDSIEIGTPGKGGCIKIYFNLDYPEKCEHKILAAAKMRKLAQENIIGE